MLYRTQRVPAYMQKPSRRSPTFIEQMEISSEKPLFLFCYFIIGAAISATLCYLNLKLQIGIVIASVLSVCVFFNRLTLFMLFASFMAPVGLDVIDLRQLTDFAHIGKSPDALRLYFVDLVFIICILSQSLYPKKRGVAKSIGIVPKDILFLVIYIVVGFFSIFWAVNKSAAFFEMINQSKLLLFLIYFTLNYKLIEDNEYLISKAFFVFIVVQMLFFLIQFRTGEVTTISNLLGYESSSTPVEVRFGFSRLLGSVGSLLSMFMGIIAVWSYSFFLTEKGKMRRFFWIFLFIFSP